MTVLPRSDSFSRKKGPDSDSSLHITTWYQTGHYNTVTVVLNSDSEGANQQKILLYKSQDCEIVISPSYSIIKLNYLHYITFFAF